jgi:hypothetical protein
MAPFTPHSLVTSAAFWFVLVGAAAMAEPTDVVWVDNASFALQGCAGSDELPGNEDPQTLMRALRERGLTDARQAVRLSGKPESTMTLTPIGASLRCDGAPSSVVFRMSTVDRSGQASTSNLVSRLPAPGTPLALNR